MTPEELTFLRDQAAHEIAQELMRKLRKVLGMATLPRDVERAVLAAKAGLVRVGQVYARNVGDEDEVTGVHHSSGAHKVTP